MIIELNWNKFEWESIWLERDVEMVAAMAEVVAAAFCVVLGCAAVYILSAIIEQFYIYTYSKWSS